MDTRNITVEDVILSTRRVKSILGGILNLPINKLTKRILNNMGFILNNINNNYEYETEVLETMCDFESVAQELDSNYVRFI